MRFPWFFRRFASLRLLAVSCAAFLLLGIGSASAQSINAGNAASSSIGVEKQEALTADILSVTLYAKTPAEKEYCESVIAKRDEGVLPMRTLYSAYRYGVKQPKDRRFVYFQNALETLCKREKIDLGLSSSLRSPAYQYHVAPTTPTKSTGFSPASFFKFFRF